MSEEKKEESKVGLSDEEFKSLKEEMAKFFRRWMNENGRIHIEEDEKAELFLKEFNDLPKAAAVDENKISFEDQIRLKDEFGVIWNDFDSTAKDEEKGDEHKNH